MLNNKNVVKAFKVLIFALRTAAAWVKYEKLVSSCVTKKMKRIYDSHGADYDV